MKPAVETALNTVSTDDAYVNGHVTFVAPRVAGQVNRVLVDDNYRVKKGDIWSSWIRNPTRFKSRSRRPPWRSAETDLAAAQAQVRGLVAQARANRYKLEHAIEDVQHPDRQPARQRGDLKSRKATLDWPGQPQTGRGAGAERGHQQGRTRPRGRPSRSMRRPSIRPPGRLRHPGRPGASRPAAPGPRPGRSAGRPRPELLRRPPGNGTVGPERGPVRLFADRGTYPRRRLSRFYK